MIKNYSHLEEIPDVPLFAYHIVMVLASSDSGRLGMDDDFLYYKAHALEAFAFGAILPDCIVIYFMDAVYEAYLE